jgi:hypothetical protein
MCRREMIRALLRVSVWEGILCGSAVGCMREVMPVWVRVCVMFVRLVTLGMMSTCVPYECERRAFVRGCIFLR